MTDDSTVPVLVEELFDGIFKATPSGTADIDAGTAMYISADKTVSIIAGDETEANVRQFIGRTIKNFKYGYDAMVTLQTKFRNLEEFVAGGTITYGQYVKFEYGAGAINGQVVTWIPGTDDADQIVGMVWLDGADTDTVEILTL